MSCDITREHQRPSVGFLSAGDSKNVRTWSGTPYYMARALEKHFGPVVHVGPLASSAMPFVRSYASLFRLFTGKRYLALRNRTVSRELSSDAARKVRVASPDLVFAPAGSVVIGRIPKDVPLVYSSDATARLVLGYHPNYRDIAHSSRRATERLEGDAIERADLILCPTEWVARSSINDYGADPNKVHIIEYGANLIESPDREAAIRAREPSKCRLLFVGVDWKEKGADLAIDALAALQGMGIDAEMTICGCEPRQPICMDGLTIIPFLDKNNPEQLQRLMNLYWDADFFILPTRAECYGIAYCEASAYGVPSIGTATGGVPYVVREAENGHLLPLEADGAAYARLIADIYTDRSRYNKLRVGSRERFERALNWDVWGSRASRLIAEMLARHRADTRSEADTSE